MAQSTRNRAGPRPLRALQIAGFCGLLAYPFVTVGSMLLMLRVDWPENFNGRWFPYIGPAVVLLSFMAVGAGFRMAGGVVRGALVGAVLYALVGAAYSSLFLLVGAHDFWMVAFNGAVWPLYLLQTLGIFAMFSIGFGGAPA